MLLTDYLPGGLRACSCSACHPSRKNKSCFSGKRLFLQSTRSQPVRLQPSTWPLIWKVQTAHVPSDPTGTSSRCGETSAPPFANPRNTSSLHRHTCAIPTFPTNPYDTCLAPSYHVSKINFLICVCFYVYRRCQDFSSFWKLSFSSLKTCVVSLRT